MGIYMNILEDLKNSINSNYKIIVVILLLFILFNMANCTKQIYTLLGGGYKHNETEHHRGGSNCKDERRGGKAHKRHSHDERHSHGGKAHKRHSHDERHSYGGGDNGPLTLKLFWVSWCGHC